MKISCCWLYAIGVYGFPPKIEDIKKAIREMADMGFKYIELEGMGYENMASVAKDKEILKEIIEENKDKLIELAETLKKVETLDRQEFEGLMNREEIQESDPESIVETAGQTAS